MNGNTRGIVPLENTVLLKRLVIFSSLVANLQFMWSEWNLLCQMDERPAGWKGLKKQTSNFVYTNIFSCCAERKDFDPCLVGLVVSRKGRCKANALELGCGSFASKAHREQRSVEVICPRVNLCSGNAWAAQSRLSWLPKISSKSVVKCLIRKQISQTGQMLWIWEGLVH